MAVDEAEAIKLRVAVLCGGPSPEREVSLSSGRAVHEALAGLGVASRLVDLPAADLLPLDEVECDVAFNALHGEFGEDGAVQRLLEERGLAYTASRAPACERAFDKVRAKRLFARRGLPTPAWTGIGPDEPLQPALAAAGLDIPVVAKPVHGGSSQGVTLVGDRGELQAAVAAAAEYDRAVLVERLIEGREVTVGMLDGEALPVVELRTPRTFYDYTAKYADEKTEYLCPAPLPQAAAEEARRVGLAACEAVGAEHFARVDLRLDRDLRPYLLEVNTVPGFTSHSLLPKAAAAVGIDFPHLCLRIVALGWARHQARAESRR